MKAIFIEQTGGPEVLQYGERPKPEPGSGEVLVKLAAAGVNFTDISLRKGSVKAPLPAIPGSEGAGTLENGERVAYSMVRGAYAEYAAVPEKMLVRLPDDIDFRTAAAVMLQGMTAHYLTHSTFPLKAGQVALVHAAAGGTGRLIVQMAAMLGARVIATVGSEEKAQIAREAGASKVVLYDQDWVGDERVDVVYDAVGQATFLRGLDCLKPKGMMVHFGQSSGSVPPLDTRILASKGSLYLARPSLANHISPEELKWRAGDLFGWIREGKLKLRIEREYPLEEAARAHRELEGRQTSGKILLWLPGSR